MLDDPTIHKAVQFAVATEVMGAQAYSKLAEKFSDQKEISEAFSLLATDEKAHGARFKAILDELPAEADIEAGKDDYGYLLAMAKSEFFDEGGLAVSMDQIATVDEALVQVLEFEKATLGFYRAIQDILGKNDAVDAIIQEEKQHIVRLMKYVLTDEKMKGLGDES